MKTFKEIQVRVFPVYIRDERTGETTVDEIVITKEQLRAAQVVGMDSNKLIFQHYNERGYWVLTIGKPVKAAILVDLMEAYHAREASL